ncbi:MAG: hypothetical protein JWM10_1546 [Myxococcaceae bacterium]|nr:hypothetical protein [Myxococcaceae bacterium]
MSPRPPPDGLPSWRAFGTALLRPPRPRLAEALAVATGIALDTVREAVAAPNWDWRQLNHQRGLLWSTPSLPGRLPCPHWAPAPARWSVPQLWEALATRGLVPDAWIDDPTRRFHGGGRAPATMTEAVLLASDAEGIAAAEALARETALRLGPWLQRGPPRTVRWRLVDWSLFLSDRWRDHLVEAPGGAAVGALLRSAVGAAGAAMTYRRPSLTAAGVEVAESPNVFRELAESVASIVSAAELWSAAPDPFAPLLTLWARGYGLLDTRPALTLLLPTFEGHGPPTRVRGIYISMGRSRPPPDAP